MVSFGWGGVHATEPEYSQIHVYVDFWHTEGYGYFVIQFCGKEYCGHRLICEAFYGISPPGKPFVDHIDRNRSNNGVGNLRWASHLENSRNSSSALGFAAIHVFNAYSHPSAYRAVYYQGHKDTISKRDAAYRASKKKKKD